MSDVTREDAVIAAAIISGYIVQNGRYIKESRKVELRDTADRLIRYAYGRSK